MNECETIEQQQQQFARCCCCCCIKRKQKSVFNSQMNFILFYLFFSSPLEWANTTRCKYTDVSANNERWNEIVERTQNVVRSEIRTAATVMGVCVCVCEKNLFHISNNRNGMKDNNVRGRRSVVKFHCLPLFSCSSPSFTIRFSFIGKSRVFFCRAHVFGVLSLCKNRQKMRKQNACVCVCVVRVRSASTNGKNRIEWNMTNMLQHKIR